MNTQHTHHVIYEESQKVQAQFDQAFDCEIRRVCATIDKTLQEHNKADASLPSLTEPEKEQKAHCLALTQKNLNDIIGSLELFRLGYFDLSLGTLRGVIEGLCTAVLINADQDIYTRYKAGQHSVNKSVDQVARRNDLGLSQEATAQLKKAYEWHHQLAHPTILAVATQSPLKATGYPIGGIFDPAKIEYYRAHLEHLGVMAENISGFIQAKLTARQIM